MTKLAVVLAALAASGASVGLLACSSSSGGGNAPEEDAASDQTSPDGTTGDGGPAEASAPDAGSDASDGSAADAGRDADAAPDAPAEAEAGPPTCTPVDAGVDAAAVAAGQVLVGTDDCTSCHGGDLSGGVTVMGALSKNLTPDPATGLGCWTDSQIATSILYGTTPDGGTLCVMPVWATTGFHGMYLDADQAEQIVQYLRTVPAVSDPVADTDCVALGFGPDAGADGGDASVRDAAPDARADAGDAASE